MADDEWDSEPVEGVIVDDPEGSQLAPLVPEDIILTPCHHGCTCGLHQQVVYGERVPRHEPTDLDHGEMALLVEAAVNASRLLNDFHDHLRRLREAAVRTHGQASRALRELTLLLTSDAAQQARAELDRVEAAYADLTPAERQPAPRWLKALAILAAVFMACFDAYFFRKAFLDILGVTIDAAWWERDIGLAAAIVLAIGLIATGRVVAGPAWRMGRRWRRPASPDEAPPRRAVRLGRIALAAAAPAAILIVFGWWAAIRGQAGVVEEQNALDNSGTPAPLPNGLSIMLLLVSMAITVIVLEVLVYNPYQADMRRAERGLARLRKRVTAGTDAVTDALDTHEIAWRDLRSARDEVIAFVQAELARPWQTVILPARLRHGKAGPKPAKPKCEVKIEMPTVTAVNGDYAGADRVKITYQLFDGIPQPQPDSGPLAEVVRAVLDLSPERLRREQRRLELSIYAQFGEPGPGHGDPGEDPAAARPEDGR